MKYTFATKFNGKAPEYFEVIGIFTDVSLEEYAQIIDIFSYEYDYISEKYHSSYSIFLKSFDISIFERINSNDIKYLSTNSFEFTLAHSIELDENIIKKFTEYFEQHFK
jgi:hypothetical protein